MGATEVPPTGLLANAAAGHRRIEAPGAPISGFDLDIAMDGPRGDEPTIMAHQRDAHGRIKPRWRPARRGGWSQPGWIATRNRRITGTGKPPSKVRLAQPAGMMPANATSGDVADLDTEATAAAIDENDPASK